MNRARIAIRLRLPAITRGSRLLLAALAAGAMAIPASSGATSGHPSSLDSDAARALKSRRLLVVKAAAVQSLAAGRRYLTWELASSRAHPRSALMERDESTRRLRRLASDTLPQFGLASTATGVVYAARAAGRVELRAVGHDGSHRMVLSRSLAAPIASRGNRVAWAEQDGSNVQRVVVADTTSGRRWVAASTPRCRRGRCYRVDAVTLAERGVVFDRAAIGSHPSLIVRRRFGDSTWSAVRVANDPQPDLAASSAGAFYYWLGHGWVRWDFGKRRPQLTRMRGLRRWVLGFEQGRVLLVTGSPCRPRLEIQLPDGRRAAVAAPTSTPVSPTQFGRLCRAVRDFDWEGRRLAVAWSVVPQLSLRAHTDVGLAGVVTATATP